MSTQRIVLAYSGGLDTSIAIAWLAETRDNLLGVIESGSQATQQMFDEVREDIRAFRQETNSRFDGLGTQMRALHEDVIERISRLGAR